MTNYDRLRNWLRLRFNLTADMRDGAGGWRRATRDEHPNALPAGQYDQQYTDALEAWRKNPYAKRIIDLITDYTIGDTLAPTADGELGRFIQRFWSHPQNRMELRLPELVDELSRAGDLFLALFRNPADGMSYIRPVPKSDIDTIVCADEDWETEIEFVEKPRAGETARRWLSAFHPDAGSAPAVMLHYSINRPVGAQFGESELASILPWLMRYSRMLEDRVRLNAAARSFLWFTTVPTTRVQEKREQYAVPPEPGSIIIKDDGETWEMQTPNLHGYDAQHDLRALRQAISAGSGQPPHWHGDGGDINRAVAEAMQDPAVRRLRRRQKQTQHMLIDICHTAYSRSWQLGRSRRTPSREAIRVTMPDISREDNESLALAGQRLSSAFSNILRDLPTAGSATMQRLIIDMLFRFTGETLDDTTAATIVHELQLNQEKQELAQDAPPTSPAAQNGKGTYQLWPTQ